MAMTYPEPLALIDRNMVHTESGVVSAHYLLEGINVSTSNQSQVENAQLAHAALFKALGAYGLDFSIFGFKTRTDPEELLRKMSTGVPGLSQAAYPEFFKELSTFAAQLETGLRREFKRVYWLQVFMPRDETTMTKLFSSVTEADDLTEDDIADMGSLEDRVFKSLPRAFQPKRLNADHFRWVYDRARMRGIEIPTFPMTAGKKAERSFSLDNFPDIYIRKNADGTALVDGFVELFGNGNAKVAKKSFMSNFRSAQFGTALSVSNIGSRRGDIPNGATSYQSIVTIAEAPRQPEINVSRFTSIVDMITNVDADFVQHVSFNPEARTKDHFRSLRSRIESENAAVSKDDMDTEEYQTKGSEIEDFRHDVMQGGAIPMRVTTMFCFAHQNLESLEKNVLDIINLFDDNDFSAERVTGAQYDGWTQFFPGVPISRVTEAMKLDTTAYRFSAAMPARTSLVGDPTGIPFAINKENELGQIIFLDILNATDKGNASIAVTGAQGSGKTHGMKLIMGYLSDLNKTVHVLDPSPHGEYEVFARELGDVSVVNVVEGNVSIDPLKVYDPEQARTEFIEIMFPLLQVNPQSRAATIISNMLEPRYRAAHNIDSTRDLLNVMRQVSGEVKDLKDAYNALNFFAQQDYSRAIIDPLDNTGRIIDLPALDPKHNIVVFRTAGLTVSKSKDEDPTPKQRMSQALFLAIAIYTAHRFNKINDVCVLVGDEMHTLKGNERVMDMLIKTPDRMGRKDKNWILAGSQLAEDMDENFALIRKRVVLKQEKIDNAKSALEWIDLDGDNPVLVERLINQTSPLDPATDRTQVGREGEGWFNDGRGHTARVKIFNHLLPDRERASDTTSSRMTRA